MCFGFIDTNGNYYEIAGFTERLQNPDQKVPIRPSKYHIWSNGEWVFSNDLWRQEYAIPKARELLTEADRVARQYETQKAAQLGTTDTEEIYNQVLVYMQQIRDTVLTMTPDSEIWPDKPAWKG